DRACIFSRPDAVGAGRTVWVAAGDGENASENRNDDSEARAPDAHGRRAEISTGMTIDFEDLELPLAEVAAMGAGAPSASVRDRLMARVRADEPAVPAGFAFSFAATDRWLPHPVPGIRMRVLAMNRANGYATLLLDVDPGVHFPEHHHTGAEECY